MATKPVNIKNDKGDVDNDPVTLSVIDEVTWTSSAPHATVVVFEKNETPFVSAVFRIPAGGSVSSGPVQNSTPRRYKYDVKGTAGSNDPTVIINR
jgi:hypothetical protein